MRSYARIEGSRVAEVVRTAEAIELLYHPAMAWVDVTGVAGVAEGWRSEGGAVRPPEPVVPGPAAAPATAPSLEELKARIDALHAEITLLAGAAAS